ncbi:hypothetical protein [Slackia piriformis]|uniref:hypothetical protein n=1 Tax=Slackia piriformis TaxID=626934 RepID=UPI0023F0F2D3|nr:hypothetical protein [Slackia piriformis]
MYDVIKLVIDAGGYSLPDVLGKIEREWVLGHLADEERDQLIDAARANATPEGSMAPLQERMAAVELAMKAAQESIEAMDARLKTLEGQEPPEPPVVDEWPEFVRPTGAHDAYPMGAKITYKGKRYVSLVDANCWPPDEYPQGWQEQN